MKRILVVDDEPDMREVMSTYLEMEGFECSEAENGLAAIEAVKAATFDAVVSDVRMPECDGAQMLMKLREMDQESPIVFMVTGYPDYSTDFLIDAGAAAVFLKPMDRDKLILAVKQALGLD